MKNPIDNSKFLHKFKTLPLLLCASALSTYSYAQTLETQAAQIDLPNSLNSSNVKGNTLSHSQLTDFWQRINERKLDRINSTWRYERQSNPQPSLNIEKEIAKSKTSAEKFKNVAEDIQEKILAANRKFALDKKAGFTSGSQMNFVRVGPTVKAEIIDDGNYLTSGKIRIYNFFDAQKKLAVNLDSTTTPDSQIDKNGFATKFKFIGIVTRDVRGEVLPNSSPNEAAVLLAAANIADYFPQNETTVTTEADLIYLDKQAKEPRTNLDMTFRLVLKKESLQPVRLLTSWLSKKRKGWMAVYEVKADKSIDGFIIPSRVALYTADSNQPGGSIDTYVLQQVKVNDAVDPQALKLPANAEITDYRFGKTKEGVTYKLTNGLPLSDEQVKKLLGERPQPMAGQVEQQMASRTPLLMLVGLCLLATGGVMWRKGAQTG